MKNGFVIAIVLLILIIAFCVSGTVMSKEKTNPMKDDERYTAWEETFVKHIKSTLAGQGYQDSGIIAHPDIFFYHHIISHRREAIRFGLT